MRVFRPLPFLLLIALTTALTVASRGEANRQRYNFNAGWLVKVGDAPGAEAVAFDDSGWKHVTTPYAWNEDSAFRVSIHDLPTGIAWYRKHFRLPANSSGQKVFVEFEGIRQAGDVYLNGKLIGRHEDGVMAFGFDLTKDLKASPEDNVLSVRTDNRWDYKEQSTGATYHWNNTNFYANYGGITKNVWLHVTPQVYQTLPLFSSLGTTGTYIYATDFDLAHSSARIHVESEVRNDSPGARTVRLHTVLLDLDGHTVARFDSPQPATLAPNATASFSADAVVPGLHLWSWGYGYLYNVVTTLVADGKEIDRVTTRTGFRSTAFRDGMIYLNGRVLQVHGYGQRTTNEWPAVGLSVPPWMSDLSNRLMVESNGNLVRWMHVTPWKQDVESSDRVGLIESMPAGDAEGDSKGRQWEQRVALMRDAIIYNRNNPSILFYESGNKGISDEHMAEMKRVRDQYDPHGGRAIGAREMLGSHTAEYGGEMLYINKSATKPLWSHEYNRDEGARKFQDLWTPPFHKNAPLYNRDGDSFTLEDVRTWDDYFRARPGTGRRVSSGGVNIIWSDSNTHFRGDNNYRRSGEVDAMRLPKDAFFAHQAMWDGWVDPEHPHIHIVGHWNYAAGTVKPVYVVAAAPRGVAKVELRLNGRSLGSSEPTSDFLFPFDKIAFAPGRLEALAYDAHGKVLASTALETAGPAVALKLTPRTGPKGLRADGADMALVDVEVVDAQGRRCPAALNLVHFSLDGAAEWRGGIAQGSATPAPVNAAPTDNHGLAATEPAPGLHEDNYILSRDLPVEAGVNRIILRSLPTPGAIHLIASADGLPTAHIDLISHAIAVHHGLSTDNPSADQPVNLGRGPTPATPSFTPTRTEIPIASAIAGANPSQAALSFDDNETTSWSNDPAASGQAPVGQTTDGLAPRSGSAEAIAAAKIKPSDASIDTAWIEYNFAQPEEPTGVDLKLNGFRLRRYPLRITLDGQTVYEGLTPVSLGYCNLPLKPVRGQHLRLTLTGPPLSVTETNAVVEITGKLEQSGTTSLGKPGRPVLNLIEADIYRSAAAGNQPAP